MLLLGTVALALGLALSGGAQAQAAQAAQAQAQVATPHVPGTPAHATNITVYHVNPKHLGPKPINMDTGDSSEHTPVALPHTPTLLRMPGR